MKSRNTWVALVAVVFLFSGSGVAKAGTPGDGLYVGGLGGFGMAVVGGDFKDNDPNTGNSDVHKFNSGGLGAEGAEWGAFLGYGLRMGPVHASFEAEGAWSDIEIEASIAPGFTPNKGSVGNAEEITSASAEMFFSGAATFRVGLYLNPETLLYAKGGGVGSAFDVAYGGHKEEYWVPGVRLGAGIESTLFDGFSVRVEALHNNYYDADVYGIGGISDGGEGADSNAGVSVELHPSSFVGRVGISYNFSGLL
jgi:hypothetical protein